jgi:pyruvate ferredoxin oxidoreductase delta subunit
MNKELPADFLRRKLGSSELPIGTVMPYPGSSLAFKTGDWAAQRPSMIEGRCTSCLTCYFVCPDGAVSMDFEVKEKGLPRFDYEYCKGCGLCANECPVDAIEMKDVK